MSKLYKIPEGIKTVLITGGGSGIGKAFVNEFARLGLDCVLVGKNKEKLIKISNAVEKEYAVKTWVIEQDLSIFGAGHKVFNYCKENNIEVDILVNNAGKLIFHEFATLTEEQLDSLINLHIHCTTLLTYLFGKEMLERKRGFIINISSASAWMNLPGIHVYNATKSYVRNFSRSLYYEFVGSNVGVTVVCPSGVDTAFFKLSKKLRKIGLTWGLLIKPKQVAEISIRKAFRFKKEVLPNSLDSLLIFITKNLTDPIIFWIMKKLPQFKRITKLPFFKKKR